MILRRRGNRGRREVRDQLSRRPGRGRSPAARVARCPRRSSARRACRRIAAAANPGRERSSGPRRRRRSSAAAACDRRRESRRRRVRNRRCRGRCRAGARRTRATRCSASSACAISFERPPRGPDECRPQRQILGRVARHRELREQHEIGVRLPGFHEPADDPVAVPVEVADDAVDLGERESLSSVLVRVFSSRSKTLARIALPPAGNRSRQRRRNRRNGEPDDPSGCSALWPDHAEHRRGHEERDQDHSRRRVGAHGGEDNALTPQLARPLT